MKAVFPFLFAIQFASLLSAQSPLDQLSMLPAQNMVDAFNSKNYRRYVDYLLPSQYDNDVTKKDTLARNFEKAWKTDTSRLQIRKVLATSDENGVRQILFQAVLHQRMGYVLGKSTDGGLQWLYSQFIGYGAHFDFLLEMLPDIDLKFSDIIDPKFNKRISYVERTLAPDFDYMDVSKHEWKLRDLRGKIVVLFFWSINCESCVKIIPKLNKQAETFRGKDVVFIAPAFYSPTEMMTRNFLPDHPFLFNIVEITDADDYSIGSFPMHVIIDKRGTIDKKFHGVGEDILLAVYNEVSKLLSVD